VSIAIIFIVWILLHPAELHELAMQPQKFSLIALCLLGVAAALILISQAKANRKALWFLVAAMSCETFIDITSKETTHLGAENVISAIFYYTLITSFVAGSVNILFQQKRRFKEIFERKNLKYAWFFMGFAILHSMLKTYTMYLSPNPAYVAAIVHAYPVWIMLGNNYLFAFEKNGHYIKIKPRYLGLLLISIVCLILMVEE
jgi:drug/metabolite transporter (DMT)-like permease